MPLPRQLQLFFHYHFNFFVLKKKKCISPPEIEPGTSGMLASPSPHYTTALTRQIPETFNFIRWFSLLLLL